MGDSGPSDSQVGDDPATFDDEGVGYGNVNTTTQQFQEDRRQENQRSNILDDPNYDAQFTADRIENQFGEGTAKNFMTPDTYAQTTQAARDSGFESPSIDIPSIIAASSNLAPGAFGERIVDTPANTMLESAIGTTVPISNVSRETVVDRSPQGLINEMLSAAGSLRESYNNPIFQAAVEKADRGQAEKSDLQKIQEALDASTVAENLDRPIASARSIVGDDFQPALDMVDARTTATGAFDPDAIMEEEEKFGTLPGTTLEDIERLSNVPVGQRKAGPGTDPTFLQGMGVPSFLSGFGDFIERTSRDKMAARLAKGDVEEKNIVRNADGLVIGIRDAQGNLIEGIDPDAMMQDTGDGGDQPQRKVAPKAPTDPCPDGYQLIDGKCTPVETEDKGTGFITFPPDRDPPFRTGPFTPKTIATNPIEVRPMVPLTFGLSNIFKR